MRFSRLLRGDVRGQGLVEYLLALSLIAFATVAAQQTFACRVGCAFESMAAQLEHILGTGKKLLPLPLLAIRVVPQITAVRAPVFLVIRAVPLGSVAVEYVFRKKA